jgi:hypothetical protein
MAVPTGFTFSASVTGTAAVLSSSAAGVQYGFTIKSKGANSQKIYFGYTSGVTALTAPATDGMELSPGEAYFIPKAACLDVNGLYLIAVSGTQVVTVEGC